MHRGIKAVIAAVMLSSVLSGCAGSYGSKMGEDNYAAEYCGEYVKGDEEPVKDDVNGDYYVYHYTDAQYGFDYTVHEVKMTQTAADTDFTETYYKYESDFDDKYISCFMERSDFASLSSKYGITFSLEPHSTIRDYTAKRINPSVRTYEKWFFLKSDRHLTDDEAKAAMDDMRAMFTGFDSRGHFIYTVDSSNHTLKRYIRMIVAAPSDTDAGKYDSWLGTIGRDDGVI